ncbi:MAG: tetratricopeptide repeat protein, partial [Gemmatimonadales bacterium]|nr:tetratricopeptide repeat protein [Gemmatimonadales bacterium]
CRMARWLSASGRRTSEDRDGRMMTNKEGSDASLLEKIRKRRMVQIALVYVGAAWLGVEITDFIVGTYAYSRKVLDTVVFLAILGFPAFLIIGWYRGERGPQRIRRAEAWLLVTLVTLGGIGTYRIATAEPEAGGGAEMAAPPIVAEGVDRSDDAVSFAGSVPDLGPNSLAVLPFRNNVPDPELEWLGSGLADLLTTNLAQLPDLLVVGRQSLYDLITEGGLSEEEEIPESLALTVARGAGARLLLWGSVTGTAGDMRIDAQLIELENGTVASADFARGSDVFELVDTLTVRLASHLSGAPPPAEVARISHLGTRDLEAWAAFHRGNALARAGDLEEAEAHYERAAEIDSTFALPFLTAVGDFRAGEPVSPDGERTEAERRRADWRERGHVQLVRRLPEDVRAQLAGLRGEELRAAIDSLMDGAISGVRLLVTERRSGRGEPQEEPPPRRPPPPR